MMKLKLKWWNASWNGETLAEMVKCQSAEVQIEILSPSMLKVKTRVEQWKRELNGQKRELNGQIMSWSPLTLLFFSHSQPKSMIFQLQWKNLP